MIKNFIGTVWIVTILFVNCVLISIISWPKTTPLEFKRGYYKMGDERGILYLKEHIKKLYNIGVKHLALISHLFIFRHGLGVNMLSFNGRGT